MNIFERMKRQWDVLVAWWHGFTDGSKAEKKAEDLKEDVEDVKKS